MSFTDMSFGFPPRRARRHIGAAFFTALLTLVMLSNAEAKPSRADFFGLSSPGQFTREAEASQVQSLGVHNVRINFVWANVQKSTDYTGEYPAGPRDWKVYDRVLEYAALHNLNIVADLYGTRGGYHCDASGCSDIWAKAFPHPTNQPNAWNEYVGSGGFVQATVERYGPGGSFWKAHPSLPQRPIYVWEVWNEPNRGLNTYGFTPNPAAYDYFLVQMANRIRTASENASGASTAVNGTQVLLGGLNTTTSAAKSPTGEPEWVDGRIFLERMYSQRPATVSVAELRGAYEGISLHPYAVAGMPEQAEARVLEFRSMMVSPLVQNSSKNLWVTELGWPSTRWGKEGYFPESGATPKKAITEADQAKYLGQFLNWLYAEADERKIVYAAPYTYSDIAFENGTLCGEWSCWDQVAGLASAAGTHKPAWCEFRLVLGYSGACGSGAWKGDNLSGSITSSPSISSSRPGDLDVFVRGPTSSGYQLFHKVWLSGAPGPGWFPSSTGWEPPLGGYLLSAPASVSPERNRVDVVARELVEGTGELMHRWWDGTKWNSEKLGNPGNFQGAPAIASWGPGRLDVFARGASNEVWHRYYDNGGWGPWENRGGAITSSPAAVSWGYGRYDLVARVSDNTLQHWYKTPLMSESQMWGTDNRGGFVTDDPGIASWGPFRLDIFVAGPSRAVYHQAYEVGGGYWPGGTEWQLMGSVANTGIAAASWEPGRIDMVYGGPSSTVEHIYWSEP